MLKVLIADDEPRICRLISYFIDWEGLNLALTGTVSNGEEALDLLKKDHVDILITDIRMPGIDGLSLIQKAQKINPQIQCVIISGYSQFEYAQRAIEYGVREYILKPIDKEKLNTCLKNIAESKRIAAQETQKEHEKNILKAQQLRKNLIKSMLHNKQQLTIQQVNQLYGFHFHEGIFQAISVRYSLDNISNERYETYKALESEILQKWITQIQAELNPICHDLELVINGSLIIGCINYDSLKSNAIIQILTKHSELNDYALLEEGNYYIGLSEATGSFNINTKLTDSVHALEQGIYHPNQRICQIISKSALSDMEQVYRNYSLEIKHALDLQDMEKIKSAISKVQNIMFTNRVSGNCFFHTCMDLYHLFLVSFFFQKDIAIKNRLFNENIFREKIYLCRSPEDIIHLLIEECETDMKFCINQLESAKQKPICIAKNYIQEHYADPLTLEQVGKQVGFSSGYLSMIFHKETGETFLSYLTDIRIQNAKDMLKTSNKPIEQIARSVGINDTKRFTKLFKKNTHLTPSEYRKLYN
ncbi:MAG: response regulator [Bilifractor sp.]|jgi:two-component system response regulator YesN